MIERVSGSLQWKSTADSFLLTRNALRRFLTHFLHWAMVLYVLVDLGRQRRFERVSDDDMAAVCGVWVKKPLKRGDITGIIVNEKLNYGGEQLPDRCKMFDRN